MRRGAGMIALGEDVCISQITEATLDDRATLETVHQQYLNATRLPEGDPN